MNENNTAPSRLGALWRFLSSSQLTAYCLAILFVLTFWGTLYQVEHGLYLAKARFFDSWFILLGGFIPLPGTQLVMAVLLLALFVYVTRLVLRPRIPIGLLITHLGLLLLLIGGAITHLYARESQLTLQEGETGSASSSYGDWEVAVWSQDGGMRDVMAYASNHLKAGDTLRFDDAGLTVQVEEYYRNARAFQSTAPQTNAPSSRFGITTLRPAKLAKEPGENIAGAILNVIPDNGAATRVALFGEDDAADRFTHNGVEYHLTLRREHEPLPFVITLQDFRREMHPGTGIARHFSSVVTVRTGDLERDMVISMNKPLRERGYTLYQASYREENEGSEQWSTFAVMHNYGRLIPYVSSGMVSFGLVWHFIAMMIRRTRRSTGVTE